MNTGSLCYIINSSLMSYNCCKMNIFDTIGCITCLSLTCDSWCSILIQYIITYIVFHNFYIGTIKVNGQQYDQYVDISSYSMTNLQMWLLFHPFRSLRGSDTQRPIETIHIFVLLVFCWRPFPLRWWSLSNDMVVIPPFIL